MEKNIQIKNVSVKFKDFIALNNINLNISNNPGIVGLVGPNGAGKTTLIHTILGQNRISSGTLNTNSLIISYCPDVPSFNPFLTAKEVIIESLVISGNEIPSDDQLEEVLYLVGLQNYPSKLVESYSRGMKQRLGIAAVLVLNPDIIFLDEPTSALDPQGQSEIIELIKNISDKIKVVISSHNLMDIEKIAKEIIIISKGSVKYVGNIENIPSKKESYLIVEVKNKKEAQFLSSYLSMKKIKNFYFGESSLKIDSIYKYQLLNILPIFYTSIEKVDFKGYTLTEKFFDIVNSDVKDMRDDTLNTN